MKGRNIYLKVLLSLLLYVGCATVSVAQPFQRIVALSPHICEMLYAIGAGKQIVGASSYCNYPKQAADLPRVGDFQRVNVEAVLRLKPDAVVVLSRHVIGIRKLEQMGVKVVESNPLDFKMIFDDILKLGELTGHRENSQSLVNTLQTKLNRVEQTKPSHAKVFYELWSDPIMAAGGPSFTNTLIEKAGGINVFSAINLEAPHVNVEAVIRAKPDIIVIPKAQNNNEERQAFWRKWLHEQPVQFVIVEPDLLHRPGPRLVDGLIQLHEAFAKAMLPKQSFTP